MDDRQSKTASSDPSADNAVNFATLLGEEIEEITKLREKREWDGSDKFDETAPKPAVAREKTPAQQPTTEPPEAIFERAHKKELVGLAFSGGGIRSATFNLGVLQGLAKQEHKLLPMFDYLSTVSGGGYIGGWLEAWLYRAGKDPKVAQCREGAGGANDWPPIRRVQECLNPDRSKKPEHGESKAIRFLRQYSNYLTPRLGFLGADTWTAVAIYLRNTFLNQLILVLFLAVLLLVPHAAVAATNAATQWHCPWSAPIAAAALVFLALCVVWYNMTYVTRREEDESCEWAAKQAGVLFLVVLPLFVSAWILCAWLWHSHSWCWGHWWIWAALGLGFSASWVAASVWGFQDEDATTTWKPWSVQLVSGLFSMVSGGAGSLLLWLFSTTILQRWCGTDRGIYYVVSFGTPLVMVIFLLVGALQLGLVGLMFPDARREWWGRLGGWLLILTLTWAAAFALSIYSPLAVAWAAGKKSAVSGSAILAWILSTAAGVFGGKNPKTGSASSSAWKEKALLVTPYVFIVGLGIGLATALEVALAKYLKATGEVGQLFAHSAAAKKIAGWFVSIDWTPGAGGTLHQGGTVTPIQAGKAGEYVAAHWAILKKVADHPMCIVVFLVVAAVVCLFMAGRVDINEFSMNPFYRNRLVRCYLGASHDHRRPNPFTGFDPKDDLRLSKLRDAECYAGPFPIVNTTLNLVKGKNLAWQERKGASFVLTPLRCGFDTWLEQLDRAAAKKGKLEPWGYRPAGRYAYPKGLRLGQAVSISGAAASPNMGYHSSPALAFLMTFFNVRLGFWAGNPRNDKTWNRPGPRFALFRLIAELFGTTDDESRHVYLSDGGHFENLGLYELVKRRCRYIIVCDAGCDPEYEFGDLANAIRKCREDIGVEITLETGRIVPPKDSSCNPKGVPKKCDLSKRHWAVGEIRYDLVDAKPNSDAPDKHKVEPGILVYLKASLTGDEPADVLNYHREHLDFPHQTTADQWFGESQFESYRRLGEHIVEELLKDLAALKTERNTADIFSRLERNG